MASWTEAQQEHKMAKATWNGVTLAETDDIAHVEGNTYFPLSAIDPKYISDSRDTRPTYCHWTGIAEYYDIDVGGETTEGGAWFYREPYPQAAVIKDRVAFWKGVEVTGAPEMRASSMSSCDAAGPELMTPPPV